MKRMFKLPILESILFIYLTSHTIYLFFQSFQMGNGINAFSSDFVLMTVIALMLFIALQRNRQHESYIEKQTEQIRQIESLYGSFRAERHDLINHVHTLSGFLQAGMPDQAQQYLRTLSQEIKAISQVLVSDNPALSALFQVKVALAARQGIEVQFAMYDSLREIPWTNTQANTVIGNVLNNAMEAFAASMDQRDKLIWIRSERIADDYVILTIGNNGPLIEPVFLQRISENGVSGKAGHCGIGLTSVHAILEKLGGFMDISSEKRSGTCFRMYLPLREQKLRPDVIRNDQQISRDAS